jgi:dephospho-CoA kinase
LARLADAKRAGVRRVELDVPLLLENDAQHGFVALCDHLVFVEAPAAERQRRTVAFRQWSRAELGRREAAQLAPEDKRKRADFVVQNAGTLAELEDEVQRILKATGHP